MSEEELTGEIMTHIARRMHDEGKNIYDAARILGYVLVGMAEALPVPGEDISHADT